MTALTPKDSYQIAEKLTNKLQGGRLAATALIQVLFILTERTTGRRVEVEHWVASFTRKKIENSQETIMMVAEFFEEVFIMLNKLPLISLYQRDRQMKARYCLDYRIIYEKSREASIFELRGQHYLQRQNESLSLYAKVSYSPSLDFLCPHSSLSSPSKRK